MTPRRLIARTLLCLFLGLATTVLIAWSLAAFLPHRNLESRPNLVADWECSPPEYIRIIEFVRPGMARRVWGPDRYSYVPRAGLPPFSQIAWTGQLSTDLGPVSHHTSAFRPRVPRVWGDLPAILDAGRYAAVAPGGEDARGWPALALWCRVEERPPGPGPASVAHSGGIPLSKNTGRTTVGVFRILPFQPICGGLLLDTALYTAAWAVALAAFLTIRRRRRLRRGHCPACAYDLRHNHAQGCPECGWQRHPTIPPPAMQD